MECRDVVESVVLRLSGELTVRDERELQSHLASCPSCAAEAEKVASAWDAMDALPDAVPSERFRAETHALLEEETLNQLARRVRPFPARTSLSSPMRWALQAAAVLVAGVGGFFLARSGATTPSLVASGPAPIATPGAFATGIQPVSFPVLSQKTVDVSRTTADLSQKPRLANVAYQDADAAGRIKVSFDVTTRYTLVGRPEERGIAEVLAYIVSGAASSEGAKGKALDLVSQHYGDRAATPSPEIISVLTETLKNDKNPGVRKKAAEALVQLPPTKEGALALVAALKDANPAIRILAVEGLAKAAKELKDPDTIQTLREKASDDKENGYVRNQAALALRDLQL
jgi:hypothetical protein